jgi:hypothetical protein
MRLPQRLPATERVEPDESAAKILLRPEEAIAPGGVHSEGVPQKGRGPCLLVRRRNTRRPCGRTRGSKGHLVGNGRRRGAPSTRGAALRWLAARTEPPSAANPPGSLGSLSWVRSVSTKSSSSGSPQDSDPYLRSPREQCVKCGITKIGGGGSGSSRSSELCATVVGLGMGVGGGRRPGYSFSAPVRPVT